MKVEQRNWTIKELVERKDKIELNPAWQRGPAWKQPRQVLLVDSILRGMDIPKVYLRKLTHGIFEHDAVDGQQRLRAIWLFHAGELPLVHSEQLPPIEGESIQGKRFKGLSKKLRDRFDEFKVSIGEIISSRPEEIRNLFARLQMGVSLNPAELRNAMDGPMRYSIDSTARLHPFFHNCKISPDRYKHLDYAGHAYAMAAYKGERDVKAPDLRRMITEYGTDRGAEVLELSAKVDDALVVLNELNGLLGFSITQKWIFVDLVWIIMQSKDLERPLDTAILANKFKIFENLRRTYNSKAENLLSAGEHPGVSDALGKHLYDYIKAFRVQGGTKINLKTRNGALRAFLK
jgi:hypothetical protein